VGKLLQDKSVRNFLEIAGERNTLVISLSTSVMTRLESPFMIAGFWRYAKPFSDLRHAIAGASTWIYSRSCLES
jgi:hypothetical protein